MQTYLSSIYSGVAVFPFVALLLTLPYMVYGYRKYGAIPFWKSLVFYAFVFYLICAYFMVILPLPECHVAAECGAVSKAPILQPFRFVESFILAAQDAHLGLNPSTWIAFLKQGEVYSTLFNVLLTVPLGMFARYFLNMRWWQALILGFCMTLFYEFSQLTGLWGLYDYAYRLFEVDDLIVNTFGCMLGFWIMIPLQKHLPDFEKLNGEALVRGARHASFTRRLAGFIIDMLLTLVVSVLLTYELVHLGVQSLSGLCSWFVATGVFFMLIPILTKGQTLGQKAVKLHIYRLDGSRASGARIFARYAILHWLFIGGPQLVYLLTPLDADDGLTIGVIESMLLIIYAVWFVSVIVRGIRSALGHPFLMLNGLWTDTTVMTTEQARNRRHGRLREVGNHASGEAVAKGAASEDEAVTDGAIFEADEDDFGTAASQS